MNVRLLSINAKDFAKLFAIIYAIMGLFYIVAGVLFITTQGILSGVPFIAAGVLLPLMGWVIIWIGTVIMNFILKKMGGVRVTFSET